MYQANGIHLLMIDPERAGIEDDFDPIIKVISVQIQNQQTGLRGQRHAHSQRHFQTLRPVDRLVMQEPRRQFAQMRHLHCVQPM